MPEGMHGNKRLIDLDVAIATIKDEGVLGEGYSAYERIEDVCDMLEDCPTVDAAPVVHGQWEQVQRWATKAKYRCSVCGREIMSATTVNVAKYPYCHCGAKMDGGNENG